MPFFNYKIGNLSITINTCLDLSFSSVYSPFVDEQNNQKNDIFIKIQFIDFKKTEHYFQLFGNEIVQNDNTYTWIKHNNHYFMVLPKRSQKIRDASLSDIWIMECDADFSSCILNIPFCPNTFDLVRDIFIRPWLQRLVIARSVTSNYIVIHGAFVEICGSGVVFLGNSGAGKSTLCNILYNNATVIADDRVILGLSEKIVCYGTPWNTKNPHYSINKSTNLSKIIILSHGDNQINNISNCYKKMIPGFFSSVLLPPFITSKEAMIQKTTWLNNINKNCETYLFAFKPDKSAIPYITNLFL